MIGLIADGSLEQLRTAARDQFAAHRHSTLLAAIIAAYAVRPLIGGGGAGDIVFSAALLVLLLLALYNINIDELIGERENLIAQSRRRWLIGGTLIAAAFGERLVLVVTHSRAIGLAGSIGWLLMLAFVTWSMLRGVLKQKAVTSEIISMSISVYLLLGLTWGLLYVVIF